MHSITWLWAAAALLGVGIGLSGGAIFALGSDLAPEDETSRSKFLGWWKMVPQAGKLSAPLVAGLLSEHASLDAAAHALAMVALASAAWFAVMGVETLDRRSPSQAGSSRGRAARGYKSVQARAEHIALREAAVPVVPVGSAACDVTTAEREQI